MPNQASTTAMESLSSVAAPAESILTDHAALTSTSNHHSSIQSPEFLHPTLTSLIIAYQVTQPGMSSTSDNPPTSI